ncbi:peptidyl-prolyl cis-trans isomerase SurA [Persephonella hydrogeniphila]|uniref:peptidylprolyl isomerase n=1 Tax=Persephonella hydrogeniphila TaxID=198703 RepID=A0A285NHI0_9AQUI|nr:peptidylprolyl isomerase [Persephonella hydrogeniphila]SNZ08447.1 peptidyl-prolyl cis-trans isomerase SurA [Persephonella hydrogeniphila]
MGRLLLIFLFVWSFAFSTEKDLKLFDRIVMVVNGQPVLQSELELAMQWFGIKNKKEAAEKLIDQIIVAQAAEKSGIRVAPEEVEDAILRIAKANKMNSVEDFKKKLIEQNISFTEFKDLIKRELLIRRYIQIHLRRVLFGGIKEGKQIKLRKVRIIFLSTKDKDFKERYDFLVKNLNKDNFPQFARKYSDDPITAEKGGLLGEVRKGDLIKRLDEEIWKRKVGDIFEVPVKNGIYFVYIEDEKEKLINEQPSGEEIAEKLKKEYEIQLNKLREKAVIEYLDKSLQ